MAITIGIVKELHFISKVFNRSITATLEISNYLPIVINIDKDILDVYYDNTHIWREKIEGDETFFGVESCDVISRIIACLKNGDIKGAEAFIQANNDIK